MAIEQGLTVLGWYENLSSDEVPPEYLWEDAEGLERWWRTVEEKRNDGRPSGSGRASKDDDDDEEPGMAENDYARFLKD